MSYLKIWLIPALIICKAPKTPRNLHFAPYQTPIWCLKHPHHSWPSTLIHWFRWPVVASGTQNDVVVEKNAFDHQTCKAFAECKRTVHRFQIISKNMYENQKALTIVRLANEFMLLMFIQLPPKSSAFDETILRKSSLATENFKLANKFLI